MWQSYISGVGAYVPERSLTNFDLEESLDTSDEWIQQRTGIVKRHWVEGGVATSDLALKASEEALTSAGLKKEDIDCIIFATLSPDHDFPGSGCFLQAKLGLEGIPAFDIRQQCTGYLYGLSMADSFIKSGVYKNVLLVGAEVHSKGLDRTPEGRNVAVLFGDGAGATILSRKEAGADTESHIIAYDLHADGQHAKELWVAAPGTGNGPDHRLSPAMLEEKLHYPFMNGRQVFMHAVKRMAESLTNTLKKNNVTVDDVDLFLFHQANLRINDKVGEMMGIPAEKVFNTIQDYGNTTAATIPLGMRDAVKAGKLEKGMLVGMAAFGSGFTWGSGLMRY
ncbi:MAG: beta-ketoacyl-ACP synthase III [Bdellovibrionota bacterium]|nr:beta-ketoacyl-ACP synthase III [Bdellovibrionota bacterium]